MTEKKQNQNYDVRIGDTEIDVPGKDGKITFVYLPYKGLRDYKDNYINIGAWILQRKLAIPTAEQTAYLVHGLYRGPKEFSEHTLIISEIQSQIAHNGLIWVFNRNLWTPKGVYVVDDPKAIGNSQELNINDLEKMLKDSKEVNGIRFSRDNRVRFAPKDSYKLGSPNLNPKEYPSLEKNGFVIASFGNEGAEKLGEVAKFCYTPIVQGVEVEKGDRPIQSISALFKFHRYDDCGDTFNVVSDIVDDGSTSTGYFCGGGNAFGVL